MIPISLYTIDDKRFYTKSEPLQLEHIVVGDLTIGFQRTVRVPQDRINSLPANLGNFPVYRVCDFQSSVPEGWDSKGFFMPMYSQEALWLNFKGDKDPRALIVAAGNINAITGRPFQLKEGSLDISLQENNYMVAPPQPWLDGWKDRDDKVYQFVAAQLGSGQTVEGQLTGKEEVGGIQLVVYKLKPSVMSKAQGRPICCLMADDSDDEYEFELAGAGAYLGGGSKGISRMGLGRGGEIKQKIYPDPYGLDSWNPDSVQAMTLYLVDSRDFSRITGQQALPTPVTIETYKRLGYPWFGLSDGSWGDVKGSAVFGEIKPVDNS